MKRHWALQVNPARQVINGGYTKCFWLESATKLDRNCNGENHRGRPAIHPGPPSVQGQETGGKHLCRPLTSSKLPFQTSSLGQALQSTARLNQQAQVQFFPWGDDSAELLKQVRKTICWTPHFSCTVNGCSPFHFVVFYTFHPMLRVYEYIVYIFHIFWYFSPKDPKRVTDHHGEFLVCTIPGEVKPILLLLRDGISYICIYALCLNQLLWDSLVFHFRKICDLRRQRTVSKCVFIYWRIQRIKY